MTLFYPAAQVLIDLKGTAPEPVTPERAMEDVILCFEPGARLPEEPARIAELYHDCLRRTARS